MKYRATMLPSITVYREAAHPPFAARRTRAPLSQLLRGCGVEKVSGAHEVKRLVSGWISRWTLFVVVFHSSSTEWGLLSISHTARFLFALIGAGGFDYWLELGAVNYLGVRGIRAGRPIYFILD